MAAERAPEPTMDEILASIKRIIADEDRGARDAEVRRADDFSSDPYPSSGGNPYLASVTPDITHAQGDEQLIADIARALNSPGDPADAGEDDILDLTRIMTEETGAASSPGAGPDQQSADDDPFDLGSPLREGGPAEGAEKTAEPEILTVDAVFEEDDVFSLDTPESGPVGESASDYLSAASEPYSGMPERAETKAETPPEEAAGNDPWDLKSAVEEDAEVLDFGRKEPVFAEAFPAAPTDAPDADFSVEEKETKAGEQSFDAIESFDAIKSLDGADDAQPEAGESVIAFPAEAPEPDAASFAETETPTPADAESPEAKPSALPDMIAMPAGIAGAGDVPGSGGQKSLEDSVKEMLRPMLREWLDDNMPRILESALRDEVKSGRIIND